MAAPAATTSTATTRVVSALTVAGLATLTVLGLVVSPPDPVQGETVRLIYVHPATATWAYIGFGIAAAGSLAYLWPRTRSLRWDRIAGAGAEVGLVFAVTCVVTGSIWGRYSWGVWWTWDARLTLTALLVIVFLGYLAMRRTGGDPHARARRCAVAALCCFLIVPVDHEATNWWTTLHQGDTIFRIGRSPLIHGWQLTTMLVSFLVFGLLFTWLFAHRLALATLEDRLGEEGTVWAVAERRAEASPTRPLRGASENHPAATTPVSDLAAGSGGCAGDG